MCEQKSTLCINPKIITAILYNIYKNIRFWQHGKVKGRNNSESIHVLTTGIRTCSEWLSGNYYYQMWKKKRRKLKITLTFVLFAHQFVELLFKDTRQLGFQSLTHNSVFWPQLRDILKLKSLWLESNGPKFSFKVNNFIATRGRT